MLRRNFYINNRKILFIQNSHQLRQNQIGNAFCILRFSGSLFKPQSKFTARSQSFNIKIAQSIFAFETVSFSFRQFAYSLTGIFNQFFTYTERLNIRLNNKPIINKRILCAHNRSYTFFFVPVHCIFIARIKFLPVSFKFLKLSLSLISTGIADCPERVKVFYFRNRSMIKLAIFPNI